MHASQETETRLATSARPVSVKPQSLECAEDAATYPLLKDFMEACSGNNPPRLLVFGDSVFLRVATDDHSQKSLGQILGDYYRDRVFIVSGSGYHSGVFEQFCAVLATLPSRPRIAVVPINLRSFSPTWDLNPLYQFRPEIDLLSSFDWTRPAYRLNNTNKCSEVESLLIPLEMDGNKSITLGDFLDIIGKTPVVGSGEWKARLETIFRHHYTYPVYSDHRKLNSFKQTIRLLRDAGVAVYCYITPLNYEAGAEYCGDTFIASIRNNIYKIRQEIESGLVYSSSNNDIPMLRFDDFAFQLSRNEFFTRHNATEHLRFEGREFIARRIIEAAQSAMKAAPSKNIIFFKSLRQ